MQLIFHTTDTKYRHLNGEHVKVLFEIKDQVDEEVGPMYRVEFDSGLKLDCFLDELS